MKNSKIQKLKKRGSTLLLLVLFMCVLATVVAVILVSSPAVDAQYKTVGCMVIDKKNAVIAAMTALSVEIRTNFLTPALDAATAVLYVPITLFLIASFGLSSISGTCLCAAA